MSMCGETLNSFTVYDTVANSYQPRKRFEDFHILWKKNMIYVSQKQRYGVLNILAVKQSLNQTQSNHAFRIQKLEK